MLFFNFLWLFYLMVFINGYTISKSDVDDYTPDSFVDSLRDPDPGREPRVHSARRGRRGHDDPATTLADRTTAVATIAARFKDSFWKRFRHRNKTNTKSKHQRGVKADGFHDNHFGKKRHNREVSTESGFDHGFFKNTKDFFANTKNNQLKFFNMTSVDSTTGLDNITSVTTSLTTPKSTQSDTTATTLSTLQSILESKKSNTNLKTSAMTTAADWVGTAQLEALLDSIKARAMQVLIDNNPTVTSLITNSVNEITFEADPLLHHIDQTTPHPKAAAIMKTSNIHKRTTEPTNTEITTHNILRRSPIDAISTMANSVEDALQNELKKVYKKLKCKVSSYYKVTTTAAAAHYKTTHTTKTTSRTTTAHTTPMKTKMKEKRPEMKAHPRVAKATRFGKKEKVTTISTTAEANALTSIDDSKLIGLLEQMLIKTSEYNVLRMMSTPLTSRPNIERLSKRNVETLADLKLKEQVKGYEHGEMMPDALDDVGDNTKDAETTSDAPELGAATVSTDGINFESISDKISYNDYVNGYKYYLKYQQEQEQDDEKFSPMIRYQAHKHHKVDDIGKFILRKIPQIRFARNIFDEIDMDDQDISTKSDDSWFKKHFYMFLDNNNTPKKFHTSETVSLKSTLTEPSVDSQSPLSMALDKPAGQSERPRLADHSALVENAADFNLDQLAQHLESYKAEFSSTTISSLVKQLIEEGKEEPAENGFMIKMMGMLLGGKDRRALKKATANVNYQTEPRFRRYAKKVKHKESQEKTTTQKITISEPSMSEHKDKFSKMGVVQMIAQPTTVVKIPAKKKSKLKNLMRKFHLSKKEKANKKAKRQAIRKQRFVPFKRIKEMLLGTEHENHGTARSKVVNDFDIMTSEIDTFKPVKFSRVPNVDEMRKEIPDITEDLLAPDIVYTTKSAARARPAMELDSRPRPAAKDADSADVPMEFLSDKSQAASNVTAEMREMTMTQLEHYLVDYKKSMKGTTTQLTNSVTKPPQAIEKATVQIPKNLQEEDIYGAEELEAQNDMKQDEIMKLAKSEGPSDVKDIAAPELNVNNDVPAEETMDVIREEIDKLKNKLTMYEPLEETTAENVRPVSSGVTTITKVMFVPQRIQKLENKGTERNKKSNTPKAADPQNSKSKREIDFESAIESPKLYESSNEVNYRPADKFSMPFIPIRRDSSHVTKMPKSMHALEGYSPKKSLSQYSVSPDHFGELLLWHSDILDVDLLTTTSYAPWVDKDVGMNGFTTPNAAQLANEVQDMRRFLSNLQPIESVKKVSSTYRTTAKRSTNSDRYISMPASTIMKDDFSVGENEVVLMGQAQYFSFSKDENLDYGVERKAEKSKPRVEKKTKNEATAQPTLKQVTARTNWTYLSPPPNVVYHSSPRIRGASRLWRSTLVAPAVPTTKLLSSPKPVTPTSKANQAPEQYFSTPLPMGSQDFEDFLKKSHLDVDSVTAPISDSEVNISSEKLRATATINDLKVLPSMKTTSNSDNFTASNELRLKSEKEYLMNALKQLKLSARNLSQIADDSNFIFSDDARFRRHSSDFPKISDAPIEANKVMRRRKIFGKKTSFLPGFDQSEDTDPLMPNKENVDYEAKYNTEDSKYTPETPQTVNVEMTKFNNLLYFYIPGKMKNSTSTTPESVLPETEKVTVELPKELTTEIPMLIRNLGLKHQNNPKRVRISYHYDVLYENRPKILKARTRGPVTTEESVENDVHNSESREIAPRRVPPGAKFTLATSPTNFTKKPSQYKSRRSKHKIKHYMRKTKRHANASITEKPVLSKRNVNPMTYTAQNVAAFEIYLDLSKSTQTANIAPVPEINALQVHIALPNDQQSIIKRQLNPSKPVFSAKMSDAVNLEYQVPALEEKFTTESHCLSPGLYMLVDNLCKSGHVTLKPVLSDLSVLRPRQAVPVKLATESTSPKCATTNNLDVLKKVTLNKDFIAAVNKHLVQLYENFSSLNSADKNVKKSVTISDVKKNHVTNRSRRDVWPALKEMLGGERTCSCHFKENHTLCPACVATDAVVEEIVFEFNNLANFMKDHCTEIQTFFWMNPNGGKKLTDSVHRLDRMLHDYYKRVKGKCQGKSCQALASRLDKRTIRYRRRILKEVGLIPEDVHAIANDIANILKHRIPYSKTLKENGEEFLNVVDNCLPGLRYKKSVTTISYRNDEKSLNDGNHKSEKTHRHNHIKHLRFRKIKSNYKREATQIEEPFISDSEGTFWSDYINKRSTEPQSIEQPLMTETTLNALTHNINELFLLFNNLNLTDVDPLTKLVEEEKDKKKNKKAKKKKKKPKKPKKKHKSIYRLHKKVKEKKAKDKANSTEAIDIDALISMTTEKSLTTRALQVILSNFQEHPSLYVKVDKIAANTKHTTVLAAAVSNHTTKTTPTLTHKLSATGNTELLPTGETIVFEEGCGVKNNFLNKLKHLFNSNNNTYTPSYNYVYGKRSARAPTVNSERATLTGDISILAPSSTMTVVTSPTEDTVPGFTSKNPARLDEPTCPPSESTCSKEEPNCAPSEEPKCPPTEEPKCPTPEPCKDNEPTFTPKETIEYTSLSPKSKDTPIVEYETTNGDIENVITEITEQTFPTIIIIDEASTESATDEVTIEIMPSAPSDDAKDLLLSVLTFEKQKLDDELQNVRGSRQVTDEEKDNNDKLVEQLLLSSKSTTKSHHPSSFATGNYSMLSDLVHASKMIRKGHKKSTKSSTKGTMKAFTTEKSYDAYNKWRSWENETAKVQSPTKVTSTTAHATTTPKVTQEVTATPHVQTTTSAEKPSTSPAPAVTNATKAEHKKASDARPAPPAPRVCDVSATVERVREMQRRLSESAFENFVRNLSCFRFRETPEYFVVADNKILNIPRIVESKNQGKSNLKLKWDWIRNQRQVNTNENFITNKLEDTKDKTEKDTKRKNHKNSNDEPAVDDVLVNFVVDNDFEKFYKGEHGIYKMTNSKRKRREAEATNITRELTDLPPLHSMPNEVLAMTGDPVTLHCSPTDRAGPPAKAFRWIAESEALLRRPNVRIDGDTVHIDGVRENNAGSYVCKEGDSERSRVRVRVLAVPDYQIISTPIYSIQGDSCGYHDLRAIRSLASAMSNLVCPKGHCVIHVHEPDCLKDRSDRSALLRAPTSLELRAPGVRCSAGCRRDLAARLAGMALADVPKLVTINVLIAGNKNKTLVPYTNKDGTFAVTRRLRRKGSARKQTHYHHLPPGSVDVVLSCPRRYQLLPDSKVCVADPLSAGSQAKRRREQAGRRPRRYDWWWYPPCGYAAAVVAVVLACAVCAACGVLSHLLARPRERGRSCWAEASRQPASPSRVILARLFKRSLSAFRHTDSQETRSFPSKRVPPPLPPIDFD